MDDNLDLPKLLATIKNHIQLWYPQSPVVHILPCSFDGNLLFFYQLQQLIGKYWFCRSIIFISPMPATVVVTGCQPINQDRHRIDFGHWAITIPWKPSFGLLVTL